jgi:hypothetical protein
LIYKVYYVCPIILVIFISIFWLLLLFTNIYCRNYSILIIFVLDNEISMKTFDLFVPATQVDMVGSSDQDI